ncbi:ATP synthase mitochondrial F1 complex assembly factor 1 isoform X3 [Peromyscus maniculatus bairdii]|uniref:ATP synthase mitochondrial F1 complex assembly factor 1 isoform X3 n=1 Tax=Peromyscus maniculatus bairdii TaxID=230844 RepID=UPI003FD1DF83
MPALYKSWSKLSEENWLKGTKYSRKRVCNDRGGMVAGGWGKKLRDHILIHMQEQKAITGSEASLRTLKACPCDIRLPARLHLLKVHSLPQQGTKSDPAAFESRLEKRSEFRKQPVGHSKQSDFIKCVEQKTDASGKQPVSKGFTKDKTLSSIFNVEMVKDKTAEEIKQIWQQYFSAKDTVYAVIPKEKFDLIWNRAQSCPTFLCALPRRDGYEFFVGQWTGTELHFTALINIQTRGDAAASQLILYHYPELKEEKGIVLMTAEMDSTFMNVAEAQCIANQVQLFYATDRKEIFGLVETFNFRPNEFKYMSVIAELEQSGLGAGLKCAQNQDKT